MEPVERGKKKLGTGTRRSWSYVEEKMLVASLKELVTRGYKCDNSFKTGYGGMLEQMLVTTFPGTDLKFDPHINSKIHVWKKQYACLKNMLSDSGMGLNNSTYRLDASPDVWEKHIKIDPVARTLKNKSFPFYEDWVEIFGTDRANGQNVQGFPDVVQDLLNNKGKPDPSTRIDEPEGAPGYQNSTANFTEFTHEEINATNKVKGKGVKRKNVEYMDERFIDTMTIFCDKTDVRMNQIADRMGELAQRIGAEFDATKKRGLVYESLGIIGFLNMEARVHVSLYLCNNPKELDVFFSLPDEAKAIMVRNVIKKAREAGEL